MRIVIITLPLHGNYGGILQNYALQIVLKRMGHTVETIVFPWESQQPWWRKPLAYGKRFIKKFVFRKNVHIFYERWYNTTQPLLLRNLWKFVDNQIVTRKIFRFMNIHESDYDAFVVGSDQVWRPSYSYKPITEAYLSFAKDWKNVRRIAYAVSFGTAEWEYTPKQTVQCSALIQLFDGVSVREDSAVKLCKEHLHCEAVHVLDPTMLLSIEDYKVLFGNRLSEPPRGQLLTYILDETSEKNHIIQKLSGHYHYQIYRANSRYESSDAPLEERVQPSVEQWLKDFYDAKFVVTDSFHATVFSILFGKPFIVIANKARGLSRIDSLLKMFGLEEHVVSSLTGLEVSRDYGLDTGRVQEVLQTKRQTAMEFLRTSLR